MVLFSEQITPYHNLTSRTETAAMKKQTGRAPPPSSTTSTSSSSFGEKGQQQAKALEASPDKKLVTPTNAQRNITTTLTNTIDEDLSTTSESYGSSSYDDFDHGDQMHHNSLTSKNEQQQQQQDEHREAEEQKMELMDYEIVLNYNDGNSRKAPRRIMRNPNQRKTNDDEEVDDSEYIQDLLLDAFGKDLKEQLSSFLKSDNEANNKDEDKSLLVVVENMFQQFEQFLLLQQQEKQSL